MMVNVVSTQEKPITTKSGQQMVLRVVQGFAQDGSVFKSTLHKDHPMIEPGQYELMGSPYVDFECKLGFRAEFRPVRKAAA